ncbi:uncharacterized protein LOC124652024 isoform X2 [Lolium rigidum]|uniref:uncharacterized protein LOC124652024 isoform X2 n=2 Tax=Lolium rigidum TaxID=89674 RepID=UPI001F5C1ED2|nr:uncharacterized protein LOC124652024 isoform X2 [Lolium rigidum]
MKYRVSISSFRHPNPFLDLQVLTPDRMLYELCTLLLVILRPLGQVAEAGVASMQLGVSMELMLCGLLTFMLGFFLMPWVLDLACVFLFVGFVTNLSGIGRAILCWPAVCEVLSHKEASTCLGGFGAKSNSPVHHQGGISHASVNLLSCRTIVLPLEVRPTTMMFEHQSSHGS